MRHLLGFMLRAFARMVGVVCLAIAAAAMGIVLLLSIAVRTKEGFRIMLPVVEALLDAAMGLAYRMYVLGHRLSQVRTEVKGSDPRPPVLLLRAFADDHSQVYNSDPIFKYEWALGGRRMRSFEEALAAKLSAYGPVIAIGRPAETVPPLGATRVWFEDEKWRTAVEELLRGSRFVVMIVGELKGMDGLAWEVVKLASLGEREKVLLVAPPMAEEVVERRWLVYHEVSLGLIPPYEGGEVAARWCANGSWRVVRFGGRQDGDYLVALGDLLGPTPVTGTGGSAYGTLLGGLRELLAMLFAEDPDSEALNWGLVGRLTAGFPWGRPRPTTWIERLSWQLGALRLAAEIHAEEYTPERRDEIRQDLQEIEHSLSHCVRLRDAAPDQWSSGLLAERKKLLGRLEDVRDSIRRPTPSEA